MRYRARQTEGAVTLDSAGRIRKALRVAREHGSSPEPREKAWVIDQMVRALLGERDYTEWTTSRGATWDQGKAPEE